MTETKKCQNCKKDFTIEPDDFDFYGKINVPPPTFCSSCRLQRRMSFRNERVLYKRTCDMCSKPIITIFSPDKPYKVYCMTCWWGDKWDAEEYGMEYDPEKGFFAQVKELNRKVPYPALVVDFNMENSDYVNHAGSCKNCYLIFNGDQCENVLYSNTLVHVRDCMDISMVINAELSYQSIDFSGTQIFFSENCSSCVNTYFSKDCSGLVNCFGCVNLRNKSYCMWNEQLTKEEYEKRMSEMKLDSYTFIEEIKKRAREFWLKFPRKYMYGLRNNNVSGDYVYECKNSHSMYQANGAEDCKYCQFLTMKPTRDAYDLTEWGNNVERVYDCQTVGEGASNIKFCYGVWNTVSDVEYSCFIVNASRIFGCVGMHKKENAILNKIYSKEEFVKLRERIISDMNERPYTDVKGRTWKYGEFFPYDLSLFNYNESWNMQYFPLSEKEIREAGFAYGEQKKNVYEITLPAEKIPDSIRGIGDDVLKQVLGCGACGKAFRMVPAELQLLQRFGFPLPRKCPDCRHMDRMARINPPKIWNRECAKCKSSIETSYAPERPEIVYCEQCYQKEVI